MKQLLAIALLFLCLPGMQAQTRKQIKKAGREYRKMLYGTVQAEDFDQRIHFHAVQGHLFVTVVIHGKEYVFGFDSGAPTAISNSLLKELGLAAIGDMNSIDASSNTRKQAIYKLDEMKLGNVSFLNTGCLAADFDTINARACIKIDGLFGVNAMRNCFWKINMQDSTIELHSHLPSIPAGATTLHFREAFGGYIYLNINVADTDLYVEFDSGCGDALRLTDSLFMRSADFRSGHYVTGNGVTGYSLYGKSTSLQYETVSTIKIDGQPFDSLTIKAEAKTLLLLGTPFIQHREVILDWQDHKLYLGLVRNNSQPDKNTHNMGITLGMEGSKLKIDFLWKGSPAEKAGIQFGDQVVALNGMDTRHMNPDDFCKVKYMADDNKIQITVRHASGSEQEYQLAASDLIR